MVINCVNYKLYEGGEKMADFLANIHMYTPRFIDAFWITLSLALYSLVLATIIGVIVGVVNSSKSKSWPSRIFRFLARVYIDLIRGTPMMVQILIIYFGLAQVLRPIGFNWSSIGGTFTAGVVILTINAGAYMAEIVRAGIESVDPGQVEASRSLGLPYGKTMTKVVLPQAIRTMLPSIINQFIISIKDTSLLSVIGLAELTNTGRTIASNWTSQTMLLYCYMALYYLVICTLLSKLSKIVEKRLSYGR